MAALLFVTFVTILQQPAALILQYKQTMKQILFSNWTFLRFLRLVMGIAIVTQAVMAKDAMFGIAGFLFTIMALFNTGCCAAGSCYTATKPLDKNASTKNISYEEVV